MTRGGGCASKELWKGGNMLYPLPAVLASVADTRRRGNLITLSWAGTVCTNPPMVSISVRPERYSYGLLREQGAFGLNLTTVSMARAVDYCGVTSGRDVDKVQAMGLEWMGASKLGQPLLEASPVNLECSIEQILELGSHHMFIARVEAVWASRRFLDEKGRLALDKAELLAYSHGQYYGLGEALGKFGYSIKK